MASKNKEPNEVRESQDGEENVLVVARCRPPTDSDLYSATCVEVIESNRCVRVANEREFTFDAVFGPQADNEQVYMKSMRKLVDAAFQGYNCAAFMYGQTGTGKTYTHSSLTSQAFVHLFSLMQSSETQFDFLVRASYYELYNEEIRDLLVGRSRARKPLELRENRVSGVYVKDLTCYLVNNVAELEKLKRKGDRQRATAATRMNQHSSRSHSIFSVTIEASDRGAAPDDRKTTKSPSKPNVIRVGRLNLIDLAGSERQSKSGSTGTNLKEATQINLSLTCLSLVIRALTDRGSSHIPYRNSKLTRLLSSSLGGNSKTLLMACISPNKSDMEETLSTLRFASRTKRIKNVVRINEDPKDALLRSYRRQIDELRSKLKEHLARMSATTEEEIIESALAAEQSVEIATDQLASADTIKQLRLLKAKIIVGGENLLEKAEIHEKLLEASRQELAEKKRAELELKAELEQKSANIESMDKSKGSLEEQMRDLDAKLERAAVLYKQAKEESSDLDSEHQQLKDTLLQSIKGVSKEIKFADCIIDDFIPREYLDLINAYAQYDEESSEWQIKYIALSGNNIAQTRRLNTLPSEPTDDSPDDPQIAGTWSDPFI